MLNLQAYYHKQSYVISVHMDRVNVHARLYIIPQNKERVNPLKRHFQLYILERRSLKFDFNSAVVIFSDFIEYKTAFN